MNLQGELFGENEELQSLKSNFPSTVQSNDKQEIRSFIEVFKSAPEGEIKNRCSKCYKWRW